ncbi:Ran-specific GTPase-activating protein 30 [Diaporthe australafricana]|uniref:Ran-specific GTPase-activating protein 30 n=1 Tax=Diaporthe australafricana TaxID=127596 RepID=A0ABR3WUG2_9PEZI
MDALLGRLGAQAVNYAIRSGIALTSSYAVGQCSRLLKTVDDRGVRAELKSLQDQLNSKVKILSPVIDLIEFKSGRGNVFLESAVPLAKSLHRDIVSLGTRLENAATAEEGSQRSGTKARTAEAHHTELRSIIRDIKALLARIDREIPSLQIAITASGETLSSTMPTGISPSRFLQASFFLNLGDTQFASDPTRPVQIGPNFHLSLYMLFVGHSQSAAQHGSRELARPATPDPSRASSPLKDEPYGFGEGERRPIWQEVLHKARVRLCRTPIQWTFDHNQGYVPEGLFMPGQDSGYPSDQAFGRPDEYSYHLELVEDLDDGRVHEDGDTKTRPYDTITQAGIRESIPIHQISRIFYTDSGRILNIGNSDEAGNNPILLLKRDAHTASDDEAEEQAMEPHRSNPVKAISGLGGGNIDREQDEIDRQLHEENGLPNSKAVAKPHPLGLHLPPHLDPEWLAFEVFSGNSDCESSGTEDEADDSSEDEHAVPTVKAKRPAVSHHSSLDANLMAQIKTLSIQSPTGLSDNTSKPVSRNIERLDARREEQFVARSPFNSITSSLSLMEMLIRLTSLQEFQQAAHLSIPDHILSFFLEETSTTGLRGEERWKARNEAERRVGFDPYTDTPTK